jgi:hypothetical protein
MQELFGNNTLLSPRLSPRNRALSEVNESNVRKYVDPEDTEWHEYGPCGTMCIVCRQLSLIFGFSKKEL